MNLKSLPFWGQLLVAIVFAVGIVLVGYKVWPGFTEMQATMETKQSQLSDLEREIRQGQAIEAKLPEFEAEIAGLQANKNPR